MRKLFTFFCIAVLCVAVSFVIECSAEKAQLYEQVIRLHIVANSDSPEDQAQKLRVRDAVMDYLMPLLADAESKEDARNCILLNTSGIKERVVSLLQAEGTDMGVHISFGEESFDTRYYDTFALPAGVYSSLRIELGDAAGKNWWCVAFPSLCVPAAGQTFDDVAASAGFSDNLSNCLKQKSGFEFRFYFLDILGKLENLFAK